MLNFTLFGRWERDAIFVLVTAYVDESGTGGDPRIMLGALAARAHKWHGFNHRWRKLLKHEGIEFSHVVAMENRTRPFKEWGGARTRLFVRRTMPLIQRYCDFGLTSALSLSDYQEHYAKKLPVKARRESCYGLCARALIETVTAEAVATYGADTVVNFVFEDSQHFESARLAFRDLKDHIPSLTQNLGRIVPGEKAEFAGLQAADLVASLGRRSEPTAQFSEVHFGTHLLPRSRPGIPMFHIGLTERHLVAACLQATDIARQKRYAKVKAKRNGRG